MPNGAKGWTFTLNNPECEPRLSAIPDLNFGLFGHEVAPQTGTPHLQGYLLFCKRKSLKQLKEIMPTAHFEVARGNAEQNRTYCSKGTDIQTFGQCPATTQGRRSDLEAVAKDVKAGKSLSDIANDHPATFINYSRGIASLQNALYKPTLRLNLKVFVLYGPAGVGKTRWAYDHFPIEQIYKVTANDNRSLWFDGYNTQKVLLIDDFRGWISYKTLLTILDIYPYQCQVKGSSVYAKWDIVVITSDIAPDKWYHHHEDGNYDQLHRRFTEVHNCEETFPAI